jgi:hypothetical protein
MSNNYYTEEEVDISCSADVNSTCGEPTSPQAFPRRFPTAAEVTLEGSQSQRTALRDLSLVDSDGLSLKEI